MKGPSEAALKRAQKLMREAEREVEEQEAKRRKTEEERDKKAEEILKEFPPPAPEVSSPAGQPDASASSPSGPSRSPHGETVQRPTSGFSLATGASAPRPSAERLAAARALLDGQSSSSPPPADPSPSRRSTPQPSGFTLGTGQAAPQPSATSLAAARALFDEPTADSPRPPPTSGFLLGTGRSAPQPSPANLARARALLEDEPLTSPALHGTPSRPPLRPTTNTFDSPVATPSKAKFGILGSPATPRRIGLGSPGRGRRKPFSSPFKAPGAARPLSVSSGLRAPALVPPKVEKIWKPVFDLTIPPGRQSMRDVGLEPGRYTISDLEKQGMWVDTAGHSADRRPSEIWQIDVDNAGDFEFYNSGEDTRLGVRQAYDVLKSDGCELATERWVANHWGLILWKLAAQVRAQPTLLDEKFTWTETIRQLKYR